MLCKNGKHTVKSRSENHQLQNMLVSAQVAGVEANEIKNLLDWVVALDW